MVYCSVCGGGGGVRTNTLVLYSDGGGLVGFTDGGWGDKGMVLFSRYALISADNERRGGLIIKQKINDNHRETTSRVNGFYSMPL